MKESKEDRFSESYVGHLRTCLEKGVPTDPTAAHELGREAVAAGLDTLELAKVHERALATLEETDCAGMTRTELRSRAEGFFAEVLVPVEKTHRVALEATADLDQLTAKLVQCTLELIDSKRSLQLQVLERESTEKAIKTSGEESAGLLEESRQLQEHLRMISRQILSGQEESRQRVSLELRDEIVQTLFGINVRLLALKARNWANHEELKKEIASTQQLVRESMQTIDRYAREFGIRPKTQ